LNEVIVAVGYERDYSVATVEQYDFSDYAQDVLLRLAHRAARLELLRRVHARSTP
jgi:hypothetical protein